MRDRAYLVLHKVATVFLFAISILLLSHITFKRRVIYNNFSHKSTIATCLNQSFFLYFLTFDFCQFCVVIRFFIPATTANDLQLRKHFYPRSYPLHFLSYLNSSEWASISLFNVECQKKGTTGTIFITSLVLRGRWLGIETGTSRTWSQHSTTRLSRRR